MNYKQRIQEAVTDQTANVSFLARLPDTRLEKKLSIVREQMNLAAGNTAALELLKTWERQIIEARLVKHEQEPELNELSEIEMELAEMETMEKLLEERMKVIKKTQDTTRLTEAVGQGHKTQDEEDRPLTIDDRPLEEQEQKPIEISQLKLF